MTTPILKAAARVLVGLLLLFSLYVLARGHNEPGGGFIGGLIGAAAFGLLALSHGVDTARAALRVPPEAVAAAGVAAALVSGLLAALAGQAPFSGLWLLLGADGGGKGLPISTVLLFDLGVWLAVVGGALTLIFALEERDAQEDAE